MAVVINSLGGGSDDFGTRENVWEWTQKAWFGFGFVLFFYLFLLFIIILQTHINIPFYLLKINQHLVRLLTYSQLTEKLMKTIYLDFKQEFLKGLVL